MDRQVHLCLPEHRLQGTSPPPRRKPSSAMQTDVDVFAEKTGRCSALSLPVMATGAASPGDISSSGAALLCEGKRLARGWGGKGVSGTAATRENTPS
ncbi:hypothetical protein BaRGS_00022191 [Batillaria attramentaria]|uniref:Uncharacterized protein n=1 Tax=Batillaria attramentaria TaxID=370345 RepID=A0ABD0KH63_9CAEN